MSEKKWDLQEEGGKQVYVLGDYKIAKIASGGWEAFHKGLSIHTEWKLNDLMDYCESLSDRIK